jgi:DNA modification methylase
MTLSLIPVSRLKKKDRNPRKIDLAQLDKLCNNIKEDPEFFKLRPCLVKPIDDKNYEIYAGNQRFAAAKKLGWKEIPCIISNESDEIIKKRVILDNIHHGEFDYDMLKQDYDPIILDSLGFTFDALEQIYQDIEQIIPKEEDDSEILAPANDEDAITKLGDIYDLNNHRLICGDSTLPDYVDKCLNGAEPILMVTDPPYGVNYDPIWRKDIKGKFGVACKATGIVQNDDKVNWSLAWHSFPGSVAYVWHASLHTHEFYKSLIDCEYEIKSNIIWVKQHFALSRGDYHWQHEPCWYAVKKGHRHNWQGARDQATTWEISNLNAFGKSKEDGEERTAHSTQKPIECMARPIRNNTSELEGVYDPFLGSGTTLIACEQLKRVCYGIELSPAYCDIIVNRWISFMKKNNKQYIVKRNGNIICA